MKTPFDEELAVSIGTLAMHTGKRPSELFNWDDPEDWINRLLFDIYIIGKALCRMRE